ncbi:uncharacterized protein FOMMEDRAFT_30102 [Fomitiporia mediterranea MF3/22]|uniref:uncharacterized protein n=1 Tax=Fomitiporia mediterranea (strain MF3/22) TaxID=694068 RepID=UPI00044095FC|nr:uncharacterized protein FOMMEDRAFT_30102 [Fomitiporia mediterranea MF3/22]EJD01400.1 hypothetical protein FOMMEDRAFT_30102 [Fomitiporia mediterranea MF3/22]
MPFPLAPHHVQLIAACYPPSAALVTAGPEFKPNSQELSRLTYYASNRPGKITKLGSELEKRALTDVRKASAGNMKARASLLITLNIFKALVQECRRDLSMLSTSLISALDMTLSQLSSDLEVASKVASVFAAWATYTNGQLLGIDQGLTRDYVSILRRFSTMCLFESKHNDIEDRNRTRLIGLGALTGAVASEALYNSSSQFKSQVSAIVPALLINVLQVDIVALSHESDNNKKNPLPLSAFLDDFRSRPLLERRAASIHIHVDGDEGPTISDVANVALKAFACLLGQSTGSQVSYVLQAILDGLGMHNGWKYIEHCCWLTQKAIEWTQYQYRFAVPARLVDKLLEAQEDARPSELHRTLVAMINAAFTAPVPLVNLSTSDICSNLTALILRRVTINPNDELLPELVECVGALGTHIYYADQIHDLACEIIGRLSHIESNGVNGKGRASGKVDEERAMALRCLIACLGRLIRSSTRPLHLRRASADGKIDEEASKLGSTPAILSEKDRTLSDNPGTLDDINPVRGSVPQRSRIPPDVWQETLSLLCDESFSVRSDYARVLVLYLKSEIRPEPGVRGVADGLKRLKSLEEGPLRRARTLKSVGLGDSATSRFLHALHATLYVLATSSQLDIPSSRPPSPVHSSENVQGQEQQEQANSVSVNIVPSTPSQSQTFPGEPEEQYEDEPQELQSSRRKSLGQLMQARKLNRIRRLLDAATYRLSRPQLDVEANSACLSDYVHILNILNVVHEQSSPRALVTGLPMLLALRSWCETECPSPQRRFAIRQVLAGQWQTIARIWNLPELEELTQSRKLDPSFLYPPQDPVFPTPEEALALSSLNVEDDQRSCCGDEAIVLEVAKNVNTQLATGLDEAALVKRLSYSWTADNALRDSVENIANGSPRPEHSNPLLKISPGLMHISNLSLQSLTRSNRGVGVSDLRDALEGRGGVSNVALSQGRAPSVVSIGATQSGASGESAVSPSVWSASRPRSRMLSGESPKDVKNVLDKLGIGAQKNSGPLKVPSSPRSPSSNSSYSLQN